MDPLALDAHTESLAISLLRHLEWQPDSFSLVFVFADVGPSYQLVEWLDQRLGLRSAHLRQLTVPADFVQRPEAQVDTLIGQLAAIAAQPGGVWLALQRHPADQRWNRARRVFLARLNERRFLLERDLARPMVLVLPADFRSEARAIAPDIWHIRALSVELRASAVGRKDAQTATVFEPHALGHRDTNYPAAPARVQLPAYDEWQRIGASSQAYLPTALRAIRELLDAGRPSDAEHVSLAAVALARQRLSPQETPAALRDLMVTLGNIGDVARVQGTWDQAEAAYRESLAISRQLLERLGGTPEALDDLAISLVNLAELPSTQDEALREEAIRTRELLPERFPQIPRYREQLDALRQQRNPPAHPTTDSEPHSD